MSLMYILETLLIGPLKLIFEIIFVIANRLLGNRPGFAIIALSLIMNVMVLPLYRRADAMQEESRDVEAKLRDGVTHIKKTFSGDERMMILQTYYRQNDYRPTDVLKGSVSLLLEIPFFMAAYQFLSHLGSLQGVSFGPIADLGAPDGLLVLGGITINLLPVAMTLINVVSSAIYLKGFPLKTKLQLYGMAAFFLVFLYQSPSGLVFYWTLNNLFSLGKNLLTKSSFARKAGKLFLLAGGVGLIVFSIFVYRSVSVKRNILLVGLGLALMLPTVVDILKKRFFRNTRKQSLLPDKKLFSLGSIFLVILTGMLIPSTYIAASTQEFVDPSYYHNPMLYILVTASLSAGMFLVWMRVFYWLADNTGKALFGRLVWVLCGIMIVNYMFFGTNLGVVYANLQYSDDMHFSSREEMLNLLAMAGTVLLMLAIVWKKEKIAVNVLLTAAIAIGCMSAVNMVSIHNQTKDIAALSQKMEEETPRIPLSKDGKNVVVIMLDRAMGQMIPHIFQEKPQLQEQFSGFTHYSNTVSFGPCTVLGVPALYGGYEYTPVEMNKRSDELMVDKHNEALKVMPTLFTENGFRSTLINPVYAGYEWIPNLSIFADTPEIAAYLTNGRYVEDAQKQSVIDFNYRNFFCFSVMKCMPVVLQKTIYCDGTYNKAPSTGDLYTAQVTHGLSEAEGYLPTFLDEFGALSSLTEMTELTGDAENTYVFFANGTTHEPMLLQAPEYLPAPVVDNTAYDASHADRFTVNGKTLSVQTPLQMAHYHVNMATMLKLGEWFDYLRDQGVYDNTRIILAADHGRYLEMQEALMMDTGHGYLYDVSSFDALLMVKDFDAQGFSTSDAFMTNADVPTLAMRGLIENPVNPFTGKPINDSEKYAHDLYLSRSMDWRVAAQSGTTFLPGTWAKLTGNLWDQESWIFYDEEVILTTYEAP